MTYDFDLKYPPADGRGDLNGGGVPDLAAVTTGGKLQVYFGKGHGHLGPKTVFADSGTGWKGALIAQNGDFTNGPYQDLLAVQKGSLFVYPNNGLGDFSAYGARLEYRPNGGDWPGVTQLIAPGDVTGDGLPDVIAREGDLLLLWAGQFSGFAPGVAIGTGWAGMSVAGRPTSTATGSPTCWPGTVPAICGSTRATCWATERSVTPPPGSSPVPASPPRNIRW